MHRLDCPVLFEYESHPLRPDGAQLALGDVQVGDEVVALQAGAEGVDASLSDASLRGREIGKINKEKKMVKKRAEAL